MFRPNAFSVTLALVVAAQMPAQGAPLANLVMTCPDESAIGQDFESCSGYAYQIPTNQLIVFGVSSAWSQASDLAGYELVLVCTIPVEPSTYSSCRDAAGIRRTAFVPKDSVIRGGRNSVIVSKTGGDYTDPVTAAENAFAGDTWRAAPHWPSQPCVMAIGEGVFILGQTLSIPQGLVVSGNGKGATMLVADNGVETAVSLFGNVRISDLTIVNSQPGGGRTTGVKAERFGPLATTAHLSGVGIHVAGAAQNVAVVKSVRLEIFGSEITAVGQDTTGISGDPGADYQANVTLERSHLSAEVALDEPLDGRGLLTVRLIDSHVFGAVSFNQTRSQLEIVRSGILGNVTAKSDGVSVVITDSSIKGNVTIVELAGSGSFLITNTTVEGDLATGAGTAATFDGLRLHGELSIERTRGVKLLRSHIINSTGTAPAISLRSGGVHLEHTFVQGSQAVPADSNVFPSDQSELEASSSVLAGRVSTAAGAVFNCTDTYGADYELLSASCQPQAP